MTGSYRVLVPDDVSMRDLGRALAALLRAGDLVLLAGELGAGKTTLAQGIGEGMRVRGPVTSPTFVLARVHPSLVGGSVLVHVDAYRLGSVTDVEDLDLETSSPDAVTVVEWGEGKAEGLSEDRLEVRIARSSGADGDQTRTVTMTGVGTRWAGVTLPTSPGGVG